MTRFCESTIAREGSVEVEVVGSATDCEIVKGTVRVEEEEREEEEAEGPSRGRAESVVWAVEVEASAARRVDDEEDGTTVE